MTQWHFTKTFCLSTGSSHFFSFYMYSRRFCFFYKWHYQKHKKIKTPKRIVIYTSKTRATRPAQKKITWQKTHKHRKYITKNYRYLLHCKSSGICCWFLASGSSWKYLYHSPYHSSFINFVGALRIFFGTGKLPYFSTSASVAKSTR